MHKSDAHKLTRRVKTDQQQCTHFCVTKIYCTILRGEWYGYFVAAVFRLPCHENVVQFSQVEGKDELLRT